MTTLPLGRQAKRTYQGLLPEFYDSALFSYPTPESIQIVFSHTDDNTGNNVVSAIIELVYTDNTKNALVSAKRLI